MSTKEGHSGLGIKSVKSVVSKYQGEIRMDITDNMFSVFNNYSISSIKYATLYKD